MIEQEIEKQFNELLSVGRIRTSISSITAPIIAARKPDESIRFSIDYILLNRDTLDTRVPLPLRKDCILKLAKKNFYAKLDMKERFHQLGIHEDDKWLTDFVTLSGTYEWKDLPLGVKN